MNKKPFLTSLTMVWLTISCSPVYKEYDKESFPAFSWKSGQEITFNPIIEDINKSYQVLLGMRHLYGFKLKSISVNVKSIPPSGKEASRNLELNIKDPGGEYIGSCAGDMCDLEVLVEDNIKFEEPGQYKFIVTHTVKADKIPGIMEVGLIIDTRD